MSSSRRVRTWAPYDGFLAQMIGLVCWERNNTPPGYGDLTPCDAFPNPGRGKMMVLATESDMQIFFGVSSRGDGTIPNGAYGGIEPAGLPSDLFLILGGTFDPFSQQTARKALPQPYVRAANQSRRRPPFRPGYIIEADLQEYKRTRRPLRLQPTPR